MPETPPLHHKLDVARDEYILMCRALAGIWLSGIPFIAMWVLLLGRVDRFSWVMMLICLFVGWIALLFTQYTLPRRLFALLAMSGVAMQLALITHYEEMNAGFFLLLPTLYCVIFFWNDRAVRAATITLATAAFVAEPLLVGGDNVVARIATTTPVFLGIVLVTGCIGHRSAVLKESRGRFQSTISSLLVALQERDGYTADHSEETVELAMAVGDRLRIDREERSILADVALLHDIGKIGIPNEILNKQAGLDEHEWEFMKRHPEIGERIVAPVPGFAPVAKAIRHEHERWDGAGYPDGISGEQIPLASRIVLVCDAFHAMITDRPYRRAIGLYEARNELVRHSGTQFDPDVVSALLAVIDQNGVPASVGNANWSVPGSVAGLDDEAFSAGLA